MAAKLEGVSEEARDEVIEAVAEEVEGKNRCCARVASTVVMAGLDQVKPGHDSRVSARRQGLTKCAFGVRPYCG